MHAQAAAGNPCTANLPVIDVADDWAMLIRMRQLQGATPVSSLTIRRPAADRRIAVCAPGTADSPAQPRTWRLGSASLQPLPLRIRSTFNSGYALDSNNGALWAGRGLSTAVSAGFELRAGPLSAALYPVAALHENQHFPIAPVPVAYSRYSYPGHVIDWPQRHGGDSFTRLDLGQSHVRIDAFGAAVGVSTENMWLGPAQRMPLLMGASAPGFPHVFVGTSRPRDIGIGRIEAQAFWGRLTESAYFDDDPANDHTLLAGLTLVFEPVFARGLFIGANRMHLAGWDGSDAYAMIVDPYVDVRGNPFGDNQLLSLFARWVLPAAGFEVYGEWARDDHWEHWKDLLLEPDHSQVYMLGFQKTGSLGDADLRWFGELAHLQAAMPLRAARGVITFYTHSQVTQGFTHQGQLLGAWIGPGSDAQLIGVERIAGERMTGLGIERVRFDDDAYYNHWGRIYGHNGHDVALTGLLRHTEPVGDFAVRTLLGFSRRHNRNFIRFDGGHPGDFRAETNVRLDVDFVWRPGW